MRPHNNKAVVDIKLHPTCGRWLVILRIRPIGVAFAWPIMDKHGVIHKTGSILHSHQRRTEPRPHLICTENFMKFGLWFSLFKRCERTDIQIERQTDIQTGSSKYLQTYRAKEASVIVQRTYYWDGGNDCGFTDHARTLMMCCNDRFNDLR